MRSNPRVSKVVARLFLAKQRRRIELARLSIEEKVRVLVKLQKIAEGIRPRSGRMKPPAWYPEIGHASPALPRSRRP